MFPVMPYYGLFHIKYDTTVGCSKKQSNFQNSISSAINSSIHLSYSIEISVLFLEKSAFDLLKLIIQVTRNFGVFEEKSTIKMMEKSA